MFDVHAASVKRTFWIVLLAAGILAAACQAPATPAEAPAAGAPAAETAPAAGQEDLAAAPEAPRTGGNFLPGAPGSGDSIFPDEGNGGIDVQHYLLDITWDPETGEIDAQATLEVEATQDLSTFNLDFQGMDVTEVTVDGEPAYNSRDGSELTISPDAGIAAGQPFTVVIAYEGKPTRIEGVAGGWTSYDGGVYVMGEPIAAKGWFPNNNHPSDKASYTFRITVPEPYSVAANGVPQAPADNEGQRTYEFVAAEPMASYLASVNIDQFRPQEQKGPNGLGIVNFFAADATEEHQAAFERFPEMIEALSEKFGPYPFEAAGNIMVGVPVGVAQEAQTRSVFGLGTSEQVIAHELTHQWFGDHVSLADWRDVWLKEGFAKYGEALWTEHAGGRSALDQWVRVTFEGLMGIQRIPKIALPNFLEFTQAPEATLSRDQVQALIELGASEPVEEATMAEILAQVPEEGVSNRDLQPVLEDAPFEVFVLSFPDYARFNALLQGQDEPDAVPDTSLLIEQMAPPPAGVQSADDLYTPGTYDRGALALHALRLKVGDGVFFKILRTYVDRFGGGNASSQDFLDLAAEVSGQDLDAFFKAWLTDPVIPDIPELELLKSNYMEQ
jgi:aminopeptidase N